MGLLSDSLSRRLRGSASVNAGTSAFTKSCLNDALGMMPSKWRSLEIIDDTELLGR
jgi:hypothetical protein